MTKSLRSALLLLVFGLAPANLPAQSIYATLGGVVSDATGAVIPNANVTLTNSLSGDVRKTVTNAEGYFTFASVVVGSSNYELSVEAPGFQQHRISGIAFTGSEKKNVDVVLKIGTAAEQVEVTSMADILVPIESGEKAATLTQKQLQDFSVVGRSAAEFIKILPGFAISGTGTENRTNFSGEVIGINGNGDGGSQSALNNAYSVNGMPNGMALDITADGSHVSDPGCNCATPVNPNTDMIQEFKVLTANFSAENSKGPAVISTVAKSGGKSFHGGGYLYARHSALNSNDWLNNRLNLPKPENKYFFPGGNFSGPVVIPGTGFNKNRDKLFFFTGYEHYFQTLDTGILRATVPTEGMLNGNFSPAELAKLGAKTASGAAPSPISSTQFPTGMIPSNMIDPTGRGLMSLLPRPNADPDANGGFNYAKQVVFDQNSRQWLTRVDYSISDNTKLFVRYNLQTELQRFPVGLWWRNSNQVPYPTSVLGKNRSDSVSASLTHVFNPTLTNEFVFGYTSINFPNVFEDPSAVDRTALNIPFQGLWKTGVKQIPAFTGAGGEVATLLNPGGFEVGGNRGLFADKKLPTFSNNISKVFSTHTVKAGIFYEYVINTQPANNYTNGSATFAANAVGGTGNPYADLLTGRVATYEEESLNRLNDIGSHIVEGFVQDSWKVNSRLTLELGLRISHLGPWFDRQGFGMAIFDATRYDPNAAPTDYSGFLWNKRDPSVPLSGFSATTANFAPRFGMAYDLFGSGKTVIRGGWGRFYFQTPQFTAGLDVSAGMRKYTFQTPTTFSAIDAYQPGLGDRLGVSAVDPKDDRRPYTDSYSFTISRQLPFSSLIEISYVGNQSRNLLNASSNGAQANVANNINAIPAGALFNLPDPNTGDIDQFRPLKGFQDLRLAGFGAYANYNSMQITWLRTKGRYNLNLNYTYGKAMGIAGNWDDLNIDNNYGVLASDRRHVFNAAYSVELPNAIRGGGNKIAGGFVNGWQLSGITQLQSGLNLTGNTGGSYNLDANNATLANGNKITANSINGTPAIALRPIYTCDPTANLTKPNQYINGSCLALPTQPGTNGPTVAPPIYGPAFFVSDLGLFKNFPMGESRKLQLRFNAYNFLNHPLTSFVQTGNQLKAIFSPQTLQLANDAFGIANEKQGRRIIQVAVKFYF